MSDRRSPLGGLVDLVVYAPLGLALTVAEELPGLAAKGRARVEPQLGTARVVGQFAVATGRRRLCRPFGRPTGPGEAGGPARGDVPEPPGPGPGPSGPRPSEPTTPSVAPGHGPGTPPAAGSPSAADLAIPGYDSLSASQVVQRLEGLSPAELAAVGEYEAATRGRRTILARVSQLQGH